MQHFSIENFVYKFPHKLPNDLGLEISKTV